MGKDQKVFNGAILTVAMRWSDRLIGLASMVILARLLVPEDFGIVAMAVLVVGFVDVILDLGVAQALIHNKEANDEDFHTAWSMRLVQALIAGGIIYLTAPFAAEFFNNPNITDVLKVMALSIVIGGLENIGVVSFQKEMEFGKDFKFLFLKRVAGFCVTITIALLFQSYWAMVLGTMGGRIAGVILSYSMHRFRPKFRFTRFKKIWSFSQWVLFKNIGVYFDTSMDKLLVGKKLDANTMGGYTVAAEVSSLPTTELLAPLGRVLFPAFVESRDDPKKFASRVSLAVGVQSLVAIPACLGLMFVAPDVVAVLLGAKWSFIAPIIQIMAISNLVNALAHSGGYALLALGKVKVQALIIWAQAILFVLIAMFFAEGADAEGFATIRLLVIGFGSVLLMGVVLFQLRILRLSEFLKPMMRPVLAALLMLAVLNQVHPQFAEFSPFIRLLLEVVFGGVIYFILIILLWKTARETENAESYLIKNIVYKLSRKD